MFGFTKLIYSRRRWIITSYIWDSGIHPPQRKLVCGTLRTTVSQHNFGKSYSDTVLRKSMCCCDFAANQNMLSVVVDLMSIDKIVICSEMEVVF